MIWRSRICSASACGVTSHARHAELLISDLGIYAVTVYCTFVQCILVAGLALILTSVYSVLLCYVFKVFVNQ